MVSDEQTVQKIELEIERLKVELESARESNPERVLVIKKDIADYENYLNGAKNTFRPESEKPRQNVQKNIKRALNKIALECPSIMQFLNDKTIRTGVYCEYQPESSHPVRWILRPITSAS